MQHRGVSQHDSERSHPYHTGQTTPSIENRCRSSPHAKLALRSYLVEVAARRLLHQHFNPLPEQSAIVHMGCTTKTSILRLIHQVRITNNMTICGESPVRRPDQASRLHRPFYISNWHTTVWLLESIATVAMTRTIWILRFQRKCLCMYFYHSHMISIPQSITHRNYLHLTGQSSEASPAVSRKGHLTHAYFEDVTQLFIGQTT